MEKHNLTKWHTTNDVNSYFNKLAGEKIGQNYQKTAMERAFRNARDTAQAVFVYQVQQTNDALCNFRKDREKIDKSFDLQADAEWSKNLDQMEKQRTDKTRQSEETLRQALKNHLEEKDKLEKIMKEQHQSEIEQRKWITQQYEQSLRKEAEAHANRQKVFLKQQHEDIAEKQQQRKLEMLKSKVDDELVDLLDKEHERQKSLKFVTEADKELQNRANIVWQNLAAAKKEQEAMYAQLDKKIKLDNEMYNAKKDNETKEREEKRATELKSIVEHRRDQMRKNEENKLQEQREKKEWKKELEDCLLGMAAKDREETIQKHAREMNVSFENLRIAAEQQARAEEENRERHAEYRAILETAKRDKELQDYYRSQLLKSLGVNEAEIENLVAGTGDGLEAEYMCSQTDASLHKHSTVSTSIMKEMQEHRDMGDFYEKSVLPPIQKKNTMGPIVCTEDDGMEDEYRCIVDNACLPKYSTDTTRFIKHHQEVNRRQTSDDRFIVLTPQYRPLTTKSEPCTAKEMAEVVQEEYRSAPYCNRLPKFCNNQTFSTKRSQEFNSLKSFKNANAVLPRVPPRFRRPQSYSKPASQPKPQRGKSSYVSPYISAPYLLQPDWKKY